MKPFSIILAVDNENGLGKSGDLAWRIPEDSKYFADTTTKTTDPNKKNAVVMGRKTWDSLPEKYKPLPGRINCVLSSKYSDTVENISPNTFGFQTLKQCHKFLSQNNAIEEIFIIGGGQLYNMVLQQKCLKTAYITRIYDKFHCDVFFDGLPAHFSLASRSEMKNYKGIEFEFSIYRRKYSFLQKIKRFLNV